MLQYYAVLRSILRTKPALRQCLTRCRDCRIFFLTSRHNTGRCDLRCAFGCREAYRKLSSTERSIAYYQTEEGKLKKKAQNAKRMPKGSAGDCDSAKKDPLKNDHPAPLCAEPPCPTETNVGEASLEPPCSAVLNLAEEKPLLVAYLQMVTSLIEGRRVSEDELLAMLAAAMRQHPIARRRRIDYVVSALNTHPPYRLRWDTKWKFRRWICGTSGTG